MGIVLTPDTPNLETRVYLAGKRTGIVARSHKIIDAGACGFDLFNCKLPIPQFADLADPTDEFKNDFFAILVEKETGQTAVITIENCNTQESNVITDDTYGEYYGFGDFSERPLASVVYIDWATVADLMGFGSYTIKAEIFNGSELDSTPFSLCFNLRPFNCDTAHGTIRFETLQSGYIHNGIDYRGLTYLASSSILRPRSGMKQQIRWYGIMLPDKPDEESDFIQMSNRKEAQIQQKVTDKYKIELHRVHSAFGKHLTNDNFLANEIYVSDYNLNNYEVYRNKFLRKVSTDEVGSKKLNPNINFTFTFKEVDEGTVKRVYG